MLKTLSIKNYALIDNLELNLSDGLTIITGETGAGKSIMLGALALLTGGRADVKSIRDKGVKSVIEAHFEIDDDRLAQLHQELLSEDYDLDNEIIMRREITPAGRSRAFINDTPVTIADLQTLSEKLIDIHGQHNNLTIADATNQLAIVDAFAAHDNLLDAYRMAFREYVECRHRLDELRKKSKTLAEDMAEARRRLDDLNLLAPQRGEQQELNKLFDFLSDADEIKAHLSEATALMGGGETEGGAIENVSSALQHISAIDDALFRGLGGDADIPLQERLETVLIELKDILATVESVAAEADSDPRRLEMVEQRMRELFNACSRYGVADADALVDIQDAAADTLRRAESWDDDISATEKELRTCATKLKNAAQALTESRSKAAKGFAEMLAAEARPLGLPNLQFEVSLGHKKMAVDGQDSVAFLTSFNKNQSLLPLAKVASGGEISRLMLAIKAIMSRRMGLSTVIFDEVDTGVSGEIADKMGKMMQQMSRQLQVVAITHLPQVASRGENHYKVYKTDVEQRTITRIEKLEDKKRVEEIARMLSGERLEATALSNAETLLNNKDAKQE